MIKNVDSSNVSLLKNAFGSRKLAQQAYLSICSFFYEMGIDGQQFVDEFIINYIYHIKGLTNRNSDIYLKSGFTKMMVEKALKNKPLSRNERARSFFCDVVVEVKKLCERSPDMTVKIKGKGDTFTQVFYQQGDPTKSFSSMSFVNHLVDRGIFEKVDENTIRYLRNIPTADINTPDKALEVFTMVLERLTHTLIHNTRAESTNDEDYQQTYKSKHVPVEKLNEARLALKELTRKYWLEVDELISGYEVKTEFEQKRVEETGAELGISAFIYHFNPNEE